VTAAAGPAVMLPPAMREAILEHVRRELPNEACGLIAGDAPAAAGGGARRWLPARNSLASPYRYELHPEDLVRLTLDIDVAGEVVWAIVHSHVASPAEPSASDLRAFRHPGALLVIAEVRSARLRAWSVSDGAASEVGLV
jgi:proteasome lid subunit RPN8/RPN11